MKKIWISFLILTALANVVSAQNKTITIKYRDSLVPKGFHQIGLDNRFTNANKATVDLFSFKKKSAQALGIPGNYVGLQDTLGSKNYFGLITYNTAKECKLKGFKEVCTTINENYAEYLQVKLAEPLVQGKTYKVSFNISLADYSGFATSGWGVMFSNTQVKEANDNRMSAEPQLSFTEKVTNIKDWTELSAVYAAKGGEQYMVFGVFNKNFATEAIQSKYSVSFASTKAYYYLSDIKYTEVNLDKDKDGIPDNEDKCPTVFGVSAFAGCPDTDGDGIQDSEDKCPTVAGIKEFMGCPDSDGDGIQDSEDACPKVAGKKETKGCPDTDGDGLADDVDRCPNVAGPVSNDGCPEVKLDDKAKQIFKQAMTGIQFETGKDVIKKTSYGILDNVVSVLKSNPTWDTEVDGHTDNVGNATANKDLSQRRANAVMKYLQDKGVPNKLSAKGYGMERPIADNKTAAGRTKNRRVEFKVTFEQ